MPLEITEAFDSDISLKLLSMTPSDMERKTMMSDLGEGHSFSHTCYDEEP